MWELNGWMILFLVLGILFTVDNYQTALAHGGIDQRISLDSGINDFLSCHYDGGSGRISYQEFTAGQTSLVGIDVSLDVMMQNFDSTSMEINIREQTIDGKIIGSTSKELSASLRHFEHFDFETPIKLIPGNLYVIEFTIPTDTTCKIHLYFSESIPYDEGDAVVTGNRMTGDWILRTYYDNTVVFINPVVRITDGAANFYPNWHEQTATHRPAFGYSLANIGDLDNDGTTDLAVVAKNFVNDGQVGGAVYIIFLTPAGQVDHYTLISEPRGANSIANLGDMDGDGVTDILIGSKGDDDGGNDRGAVYVLYLNVDGTVKSEQKISSLSGGFLGILDDGDGFGNNVAELGDINGDGVTDVVVGTASDQSAMDPETGEGANKGAIWILFLNSNGTVERFHKISDLSGDLGPRGTLERHDFFGESLSGLGDFNLDGINDVAVGSWLDSPISQLGAIANKGTLWLLFLDEMGNVNSFAKTIPEPYHQFDWTNEYEIYPSSLAKITDVNNDDIPDILAGASHPLPGDVREDALFFLFMDYDGTVKEFQKISPDEKIFNGMIEPRDDFGRDVENLGDLNGDGLDEFAVGAPGTDVGDGAVWILFSSFPPKPTPPVSFVSIPVPCYFFEDTAYGVVVLDNGKSLLTSSKGCPTTISINNSEIKIPESIIFCPNDDTIIGHCTSQQMCAIGTQCPDIQVIDLITTERVEDIITMAVNNKIDTNEYLNKISNYVFTGDISIPPSVICNFKDGPISLSTDKENYDNGDIIKVDVCLEEEAFTKGITIHIFDESGNEIIKDTFVPPSQNFSQEYPIDEQFATNGTYTVEVDAAGLYATSKTFIVPEFGTMAIMILAVVTVSIIIITKIRLLSKI